MVETSDLKYHGRPGFGHVKGQVVANTLEELKEWVAKYKQRWHPAGYGTTITIHGARRDGKYVATVYRSQTCD